MKLIPQTPTFRQVLALAALAVILVPTASGGDDYKVLHDFGASGDGTFPSGPPLVDAQGNIYGTTGGGGAYGYGTVFELIPQGSGQWNESVLFDFEGWYSDGSPDSGLVLDQGGNLYGTSVGGPNDLATVFQLTPGKSGWSFSLLYDLGAGPGVTPDEAGNLYGFMGPGSYLAGAIAELSPGPDGWAYSQLYSFGGNRGRNGWNPVAPPSWDVTGNLYGTTYDGGYGYGVAFELSRSPSAAAPGGVWTYHVMHRFAATANDGQHPNGGLTVDRFGNAYGTTPVGGAGCPSPGCGTVFKLTRVPAAPWLWEETVLYDFPAVPVCSQGCAPAFNLLFDQAGNLYGTADGGNLTCPGTCGVVFKLTPGSNGQWSYSIVHEFDGQDGSEPLGLVIDANGNLFGMTKTGGTYNYGVVFEITP